MQGAGLMQGAFGRSTPILMRYNSRHLHERSRTGKEDCYG
jgi:hypothetical protein